MTSSAARMLAMRSIDVEAKGGVFEGTCLMISALNGHLSICRLLLDKGAQVEARDSIDWTPLHFAVSRGHVEIVRLLCDRGADVEARDNDDRRPLHLAAYFGHISVVKEFIEERNAEINARDNDLWTALSWAGIGHRHDIAAYLVSHGGLDLGVFENVMGDDDDDDDDDDDEWEQ